MCVCVLIWWRFNINSINDPEIVIVVPNLIGRWSLAAAAAWAAAAGRRLVTLVKASVTMVKVEF